MKLGLAFWWHLIASYLMMFAIGYIIGENNNVWYIMWFMLLFTANVVLMINAMYKAIGMSKESDLD